ncbi:PQQ-binding-like beta-propeller repeat protein, partial [Neptuniibacter sp.]|uniref:outer membrane protein assembly factor BamB family protein n=1 Tax=Neptuniibacter sp. TaxID=1962643 RepID=UPI00260F3C77
MLLNRKLIIAVLTLGLMLSFGSAAIGYDDNENYTPKVIDLGINQQGYNQFDAEVNVRTTGVSRPTNFDQAVNPLHPNFASPERICEDLRYDDNHAYYWSIPDSYATTHWAQRMTPEFGCTLISATVAVAQENGTPGLTIQVYSDAGGYPDVLVGSWDIPNASLPPLGFYGYLTVDISASNLGGAASMDDYVFAAGEDFHIAATVTGGGTVGVETLKFYSDDATNPTDRASEFMGGFWYLMVDDWGFPGNFEMIAGLCLDNSPLASDDCYEIMDWVDEVGYYWTIGPTAYGARSHVYHKVTPSTPDTLTSLDIGFEPYFSLDDVGDGTGTFPDALVSICPDDGAGFPDTLNPIYTFVVPYGDQVWMANYEVPRIGVPTPFFVDVSIPGGGVGNQLLGTITDAGAIYAGGISGQYRNDEWSTFLSWYGLDAVFNVTAYMCRDIYEECGWSWHYDGTAGAYGWGLPDTWGSGGTNHVSKAASYQEVSLSGCDLEFIDVAFLGAWGAPYAQPAYVSIYSNDGGAPGERLMYIPVSGDGLVPTGPWNIAPHYFFDEGFWIVVESFADAWDMDILSDQGTGAGPSAYYRSGDIAGEVEGWYGFPYDFMIDMYRCCKPFVIRTCAPDGDWPTMGKNDNRDNSTFNELGDIQCNLTKAWTYVNSAGTGCTFATPIIADGKVFAYMFNSLVCVDVNTGAEIWRQDINYAEIGGSCRATPTYIDDGVTPAIYCGGGDNGYFSKFNAADGTIMWGFSMNGHAQYAPHVFMTVDDGTTVTDLVVVADGLGNIYGLNTVDGSNYYYPGFNTPVWTATGQVHKALTTDGTYLYVGCDEYLTTPNFWRLNIDYTGITVDWEFAGTLGFQLQLLDDGWVNPETAQEGIKSQILYSPETDGDFVYFHTAYSMQNSSPHNGGVLYKVKADGSELMWANESNGSANGSPSGIINDKAVVIFGGYCGWIGGAGHYAGPMAYSKATGVPQWGPNAEEPYWSIQTDPSVPDVYSEVVMPGVLTCESIADPVDNDWFIFGNVDGWWNFVDATAGEIVWHRRSARFFTYVTGPIIDEAGHIIFGEQWNLHCMANDVPRQRLHIADLSPELPVPFGLPTYHEIVFEDVIANSGCTDLEIFHVELLDEDNGTFPARLHQIDNDRAENISTLAM